jgi:hypothetical protein
MADTPNDEVKILPPDRSLQKKLGGVSFDQIVPPEAVAEAQEILTQSADDFGVECIVEIRHLEDAMIRLGSVPDETSQILREVIISAFAIKVKAGLGGYDLIAMLAKSLHLRCERLGDANATPANMTILKWHIQSMRQLLELRVKGLGGPVGEAIIAELAKLEPRAE